MILPVIYAVLTWYLAMRWRRTWLAFAAVAGSVLVLMLAGHLLEVWMPHMEGQGKSLLLLFWPYTVLVGVVGIYIACLPAKAGEMQCARCRYDLSGLDPHGLSCPECGAVWKGKGSAFEAPPPELTPIPKGPPKMRRGL